MKLVSKALLVGLLLNTTIASAAFVLENSVGIYGEGFIKANGNVSGSFPSFTLSGSDGQPFATRNGYLTTYTDTFANDTTVNFYFVYRTNDSGGAFYDKAGYLVNDVFTQLSPYSSSNDPYAPFSGSVTVSLLAGDLFGFYIFTGDNIGGRAFLKVDANISPSAVPVPAALPLMASALGVFGIARRRNNAKAD